MDNMFNVPAQRLSSPAIEQASPGTLGRQLVALERRIAAVCDAHSPRMLRISIGVVFVWFGVLKFFPSVSPAEDIAVQTLRALTCQLMPAHVLVIGLAVFETLLGGCFVLGMFGRLALPLLVIHMLGTATPFLMFPREVLAQAFVPTFLGQYIFKNVIILSAALVLRRGWG